MAEIIQFKQAEGNSRGSYEYRQERARAYTESRNNVNSFAYKTFSGDMLQKLQTIHLRQDIARFGKAYRNAIDSLDNKLAQPDEEFLRNAMPTIEEIDNYIAEQNRRYNRENVIYDDDI